MPYDLCEDDPTLDIIETAMANRGNGSCLCVRGRDAANISCYLGSFFFSVLLFLVVLNGLLLRTVETMFHVLFVSELGVNLQWHKLLFSMDMAVLFPDSVTFTIF